VRWVLKVVGVALVYGIVARLSLVFAFEHTNDSPVWPPSGIAFAAILYYGYRIWPGILIGAFAANVFTFMVNSPSAITITIIASLIIGLGNALEAVFGVYLIRRFMGFENPLNHTRNVFKLAAVALLMCLVSSFVGATVLTSIGIISWRIYPEAWFTWWIGDVTGIIMMAPILLTWYRNYSPKRLLISEWRFFLEALIFFVFVLAGTVSIFGGFLPMSRMHYPIAYLLFPLVVLGAFRFGQKGVGWSILIISIMSVWGTVHGVGSFVRESLNQSLLLTQSFIGVITVTGLVLAAVLRERDQMTVTLSLREKWFRSIIENSTDVITLLGADGKILYSSPSTTKIFGYPLTEYLGRNVFEFIHPDDSQRIGERFREVLEKSGNFVSAECQFRRKDGSWIWLEGSGSNMLADDSIKAVVVNCRDVTGRKQAADELRRSQERFQGIYDSSKDAIAYVNLQGEILDVNKSFVELTGYLREELVQAKSFRDLTPEGFYALTEQKMREVLSTGKPVEYEKEYVKKDGSRIPVLLTVFMVNDGQGKACGVAAIVKDISERKKSEEERFRLASIVDSSNDAIISKTLDGRITSWNRAAEQLYGYMSWEMIGRSIFIVVPSDKSNELAEILARIKKAECLQDLETVHMRKDGVCLDVSLTVSPIKDALGAVIGASVIARDITARKRAEEHIQETARLKSEFTSTVSHELRTPLAISKEALSLLLRGKAGGVTDKQKEILNIASRNIDRLCFLIDDILDFSKIEAGKMEIHRESVDIIPVVKESCDGWKLRADLKRIRLTMDLPQGTLWVDVDKYRFLQVLSNLLNNAVKFTPEGGMVDISVADHSEYIQCSVTDSGPGISKDDLPKLFQKFQQLRRTHGPGARGTGLGLNISKALVELHGGQIDVVSRLGHGSTFSFTIPKVKQTLNQNVSLAKS
jgi:PAS domain S-box-containing protein